MKTVILKDDHAFKRMVKELKQRRRALGVEGLPSDAETTISLWKARQAKITPEGARLVLIIVEHSDGTHRAYSPTLPGHWYKGQTEEEAKEKLLNALEEYVNGLARRGETLPPSQATVELIEMPSPELRG
ncbi:MAG: type II toxin-antitoxin system HicB family antitoxin [Anaerolineae bacterium]